MTFVPASHFPGQAMLAIWAVLYEQLDAVLAVFAYLELDLERIRPEIIRD
jgi:hypothetical protein